MYPQPIVTQSFTDPDVVAELKRTLNDRLEDSLAREIGIAAQAMQEETPVPFNLWPDPQQAEARHAARFAVRILDVRTRHHAHLHATAAIARKRYNTTNLRELSTFQLTSCYYDAKLVLDIFWARMTDGSFWYLDGDTRARIEQAAKE
jgi:hypothetical protein